MVAYLGPQGKRYPAIQACATAGLFKKFLRLSSRPPPFSTPPPALPSYGSPYLLEQSLRCGSATMQAAFPILEKTVMLLIFFIF